MGNLWLKVKVWSKVALFGALLFYVLLFIYNNSGEEVRFWWWFNRSHQTSVFFLTAWAFFIGGILTLLVRTTWKTLRQFRDLRDRSRTERLEREMADMKAKAARLQTRAAGTAPDHEEV